MPLTYGVYAPRWRDIKVRFKPARACADLPKDILPILAFDPGGHTGWSLLLLRKEFAPGVSIFNVDTKTVNGIHGNFGIREILSGSSRITWEHGEVDCTEWEHSGRENKGAYDCISLVEAWPSAAVIIEDFILRVQRKDRDLLSPVRIAAKIDYQCWLSGRKPQWQQPAMGKQITDARLKDLNVYTAQGGGVHARDADRHIITFIRRCIGNFDSAKQLRREAWPHLFDEAGRIK